MPIGRVLRYDRDTDEYVEFNRDGTPLRRLRRGSGELIYLGTGIVVGVDPAPEVPEICWPSRQDTLPEEELEAQPEISFGSEEVYDFRIPPGEDGLAQATEWLVEGQWPNICDAKFRARVLLREVLGDWSYLRYRMQGFVRKRASDGEVWTFYPGTIYISNSSPDPFSFGRKICQSSTGIGLQHDDRLATLLLYFRMGPEGEAMLKGSVAIV